MGASNHYACMTDYLFRLFFQEDPHILRKDQHINNNFKKGGIKIFGGTSDTHVLH